MAKAIKKAKLDQTATDLNTTTKSEFGFTKPETTVTKDESTVVESSVVEGNVSKPNWMLTQKMHSLECILTFTGISASVDRKSTSCW